MGIRGKKRRTLEEIEEDKKKKQLAEKDNKEKAKIDKVECNRCGQTVKTPCTNVMTCFHYSMQ